MLRTPIHAFGITTRVTRMGVAAIAMALLLTSCTSRAAPPTQAPGGSLATPTPTPVGLAAAGVETLTRLPYLQSCSGESVKIVWHTDEAMQGVVEYGTTPELGKSASGAAASERHVVELTGLEPGTTHHYRVRGGEEVLFTGSFTTAPEPGQPFDFAVIGDSGSGAAAQREITDRLLASGPDLVLHTGDVVYPSGAAFDYPAKFFNPYRDLLSRACIFPSIGNHDYMTEDGQPYLDAFELPSNNPRGTERYYSFDYGDVHFVALDTNMDTRFGRFQSRGALDMKAWLEEDLAGTDRKWKVVYFHHPPYSSAPHHGSDLRIRSELVPVLEKHGVDVVFAGHNHVYERTRAISDFEFGGHGVTYIVTGGAGGSIDEPGSDEFTAFTAGVHHFVSVHASAERLEVRAVDASGTVFDLHTIEASVRPAGQPSGPPRLVPQPTLTLCPADHSGPGPCDAVATGVDDHRLMQEMLDGCPSAGCTLIVAPGTFHHNGPTPADRVIVRSNVRIELTEGSHIIFTGADADRYVFDIDGETAGPVRSAYVGGPGRITVNNASDHGLRISGDAADVVVGDGLVIEHAHPEISTDEGIQLAGSIDVRGIAIRDLRINGFGDVGIELAGTSRDTTIDRLRADGNRQAIQFRGIEDRAAAVVAGLRRRNVKLNEARDGNPQTASAVDLSGEASLMAGFPGKVTSVVLNITQPNTRAGDVTVSVSNGQDRWTDVEVIRNDTMVDGVPFARSGEVEFVMPEADAWQADGAPDGVPRYWVRLAVSDVIDTVGVAELTGYRVPQHNLVTGLVASDSVDTGVTVRFARYNTVRNSSMFRPGRNGVLSMGTPTSTAAALSRGNRYEGVVVRDARSDGYWFEDSPDTVISGGLVMGSAAGIRQSGIANQGSRYVDGLVIEDNLETGIEITSDGTGVDAVTVKDNGANQDLPAVLRAGIFVESGAESFITNSAITSDPPDNTQTYGLFIGAGATGTVVSGNTITGNQIEQVRDEGRGTAIGSS